MEQNKARPKTFFEKKSLFGPFGIYFFMVSYVNLATIWCSNLNRVIRLFLQNFVVFIDFESKWIQWKTGNMPFYRSHSKWQLLQTKGRLVFVITTHVHVRNRHCKCVILTLWKLYCKSKYHASTCTLLLFRKLQQVKYLGFWITF